MTETLNPGNYRLAGGLTLSWRNRQEPITVLVKNCTFFNNSASINAKDVNDSYDRPNFYIPRGHGGAIVVSFNKTENHAVLIEDTIVINNTAQYNGGGLFVSFYKNSYSNRVVLRRSRVQGNRCTNVGGGISMNTFEMANFNHLIVEDSNFTDNIAQAGGGACTINHQVILSIIHVQWTLTNTKVCDQCLFGLA